jgi:hypothetical protein
LGASGRARRLPADRTQVKRGAACRRIGPPVVFEVAAVFVALVIGPLAATIGAATVVVVVVVVMVTNDTLTTCGTGCGSLTGGTGSFTEAGTGGTGGFVEPPSGGTAGLVEPAAGAPGDGAEPSAVRPTGGGAWGPGWLAAPLALP